MKDLMQLMIQVLKDISIWCDTDTTGDLHEIARRVEHEGLSFLTITLPAFCSDFERSLADGRVDQTRFVGYKRQHRRGSLPRLFGGLISRVFDQKSGYLLAEPCISSIRALRQVCLMWKKIRVPCSEIRTRSAYARYRDTNMDCLKFDEQLQLAGLFVQRSACFPIRAVRPRDPGGRFARHGFKSRRNPSRPLPRGQEAAFADYRDLRSRCIRFSDVSNILWSGAFGDLAERLDSAALIPRHGPGATSQRVSGNAKYDIREWHTRLEHSFPVADYAIPNYGYAHDLSRIRMVPPGAERPVRVVTVPKTLKTPRIIAIEPVCMQYTQQALMAEFVEALECPPSHHDYYGGHINFTDQTVNQRLALDSSITGRLATIDMKDASDRVSACTVWLMLESVPSIREAVFACRSIRADVPGFGIMPLYRFASMGSALCFPIEAMVFYTLAICGILRAQGNPITPHFVREAGRSVYVYGDDIIVPVEFVSFVQNELEGFNLQVNTGKSFSTGKFRESCGTDAYDGEVVTPIYVRDTFPTGRQDTTRLTSWVSLRNQLYKAGYWNAARFVQGQLSRLATFSIVRETSGLLGWHSFTHVSEAHRFNRDTWSWETRSSVVRLEPKRSVLNGSPALLKYMLASQRKSMASFLDDSAVFKDSKHMTYAGRSQHAYTKVGWAPT